MEAMVLRSRCGRCRVRRARRSGHGFPDRLGHQDDDSDRHLATAGAGAGGSRRAGRRLPARLPADPGTSWLPPPDSAAPADPHRRSPGRAPAFRPAPAGPRVGRSGRPADPRSCRVLPGRPGRRYRAERVRPRLATGYEIRSRGATAVRDLEMVQAGGGPAVQVVARRDHLVVRGQLPVPAIRRGLRLYPDAVDPDVFRVIVPGFGSGTSLIVFSRDSAGEVTRMHLGMQPMSFRKRPRPTRRPRRAARHTCMGRASSVMRANALSSRGARRRTRRCGGGRLVPMARGRRCATGGLA